MSHTCYHRLMGRAGFAVVVLLAATPAVYAADPDPLAEARRLYNQRQFDAALIAAESARLTPAVADRADLIAARAYLERFRESGMPGDLTSARDRLRRIDPKPFDALERTEFIVGLGEALYFDDAWFRPAPAQQSAYQRIRGRMREESTARPGSSAAAYWLAASARSQGDLQAAWDAVEAGWVQATFAIDRGAALRADLDRLMIIAIIPERARLLSMPEENLKLDWAKFKERW
jgi:hypothetical protein